MKKRHIEESLVKNAIIHLSEEDSLSSVVEDLNGEFFHTKVNLETFNKNGEKISSYEAIEIWVSVDKYRRLHELLDIAYYGMNLKKPQAIIYTFIEHYTKR